MPEISYGVRRKPKAPTVSNRSVGYKREPAKPQAVAAPSQLLQAMKLKQQNQARSMTPLMLNTASMARQGMAGLGLLASLATGKKLPPPPAASSPSAKGRWAQQLAGAKGVKGLANRIEGLGNGLFNVAELEGYQGEGAITSGHTSGSEHYGGPGIDAATFDANTNRGNNTDFERRKLARLYRVLTKLGYLADSYQNPWEANAGSAGWHAHFQTTGRKY